MTREEFLVAERVRIDTLAQGASYWSMSKLPYGTPAKGIFVGLIDSEVARVIGDGDFIWQFSRRALVVPTGEIADLDGKEVLVLVGGPDSKWYEPKYEVRKVIRTGSGYVISEG